VAPHRAQPLGTAAGELRPPGLPQVRLGVGGGIDGLRRDRLGRGRNRVPRSSTSEPTLTEPTLTEQVLTAPGGCVRARTGTRTTRAIDAVSRSRGGGRGRDGRADDSPPRIVHPADGDEPVVLRPVPGQPQVGGGDLLGLGPFTPSVGVQIAHPPPVSTVDLGGVPVLRHA